MRKIIPYGKFFSINFLLLIFLMTFLGTVNSGNNFTPDQFREQIVQNMSKKETTVELKYDSSAEELNTDELNSLIDEALKEVDPYVVHSLDRWQVGFSGNSESVKITAEFQYHSTAQQDEVVRKNVKEIVSQKTEPEMSIHQKLKEVTDYVSRNVTYDHSLTRYSAYHALEGQATCQGYALLFHLFLEELGIENIFVPGDFTGRDVPHLWNLINLDDHWYHIDTTQISYHYQSYEDLIYNEYLVSDRAMEETYRWEQQDFPRADSSYFQQLKADEEITESKKDNLITELNLYLLKEENTAKSFEEGVKKIISALEDNKSELHLRIPAELSSKTESLVQKAVEEKPELKENFAGWQVIILEDYLRDEDPDKIVVMYKFTSR